jgi:hypothetical protein
MSFWRALVVAATIAGCGDATEGAREVRGDLQLRVESRLLRPCGIDENWWFELDPFAVPPAVEGLDVAVRGRTERCEEGMAGCGITGVYLEGTAKVSPKGSYGFLGKYDRSVELTAITRAFTRPPADCVLSSRPL